MTKRDYSSPLRADQARRTRTLIATTAAELFAASGYAAVTVAQVARTAGVSAQTVYNVFSTKSALLKAAYDLTLAGDDEPVPLADRPEVRAMYELRDPAELLHRYATLGRTVLDRVGFLLLQITAGAAAGDPDLAELRRITDGERLTGTLMVARRVAELGTLQPGLTLERARDRIWTLNSVAVWEMLTGTLGWSGEEYERWIGDAMVAAVLSGTLDQGRKGRP